MHTFLLKTFLVIEQRGEKINKPPICVMLHDNELERDLKKQKRTQSRWKVEFSKSVGKR